MIRADHGEGCDAGKMKKHKLGRSSTRWIDVLEKGTTIVCTERKARDYKNGVKILWIEL